MTLTIVSAMKPQPVSNLITIAQILQRAHFNLKNLLLYLLTEYFMKAIKSFILFRCLDYNPLRKAIREASNWSQIYAAA